MITYEHTGYIHYKDLPQLDPAHAGTAVFVDTSAEDTYAYWLERHESSGLAGATVDITGVLDELAASVDLVVDSPPVDVLLTVVADEETSGLAEQLYHRGPHQVSWDLTHYTPGVAPIPEHVVSTPELTGLLRIGGAGDIAWRTGCFWMDAHGHTAGYPRMPGFDNPVTLPEDLWCYCAQDLGTVLEAVAPGRNNIWDTHWQQACVSRADILSCTNSPYAHTRRYATEYRRRLMALRRAVRDRRV